MVAKNTYRALVKKIEGLSQGIRVRKQFIGEWKDVLFGKDAKLIRQTKLTRNEKREIQEYWQKKYGKKIPLFWHRRYKGYSGRLDIRYFPEILYTTKLEPKLNPDRIAKVLHDKSLIEFLYAKVLQGNEKITIPKTVGGCSGGYYYDELRRSVTYEELIKQMSRLVGDYIIKPSVGESSGHGVRLLQLNEGIDSKTSDSVEDIVKSYGENFIIQEKIILNKGHAALHPESANTIRIMTYRVEDKIKHAPMIMRIGRGKSHLDNAHAGRMYVAV